MRKTRSFFNIIALILSAGIGFNAFGYSGVACENIFHKPVDHYFECCTYPGAWADSHESLAIL